MPQIAVRCAHRYSVATVLKPNCGINYQTFGTTDTEIRMNKENALPG